MARFSASILAAVTVVALASPGIAQAEDDLCFGLAPTIVGQTGPTSSWGLPIRT